MADSPDRMLSGSTLASKAGAGAVEGAVETGGAEVVGGGTATGGVLFPPQPEAKSVTRKRRMKENKERNGFFFILHPSPFILGFPAQR